MQKRYPVQAFLDMYFFDSLMKFSNDREEHDRLYAKTKKFAQLSQKYYNLLKAENDYKRSLKVKQVVQFQC